MGREATKAAGNVWYEARIEAAKWDDRLSSREGAAEVAGLTKDQIMNSERDWYKFMPVETAMILSETYNAPNLLNHYCLHECPIGKRHSISESVLNIDRVTVKLLRALREDSLADMKDKLLDIAEDGKITADELDDLEDILKALDGLGKTVSELKIIGEKALKAHGRSGG